jgi:6-pyruvoyltetrahydropterin/6-carboxytetrahydropterin synthase
MIIKINIICDFMKQYIYINGWKTNIRFSSAHIIPEYKKCGRLHGHTYAVHAKIYGKPDSKGIIIDFSIVKNALKKIVNKLDHMVLIPEKSKIVELKIEKDVVKIISLNKTYILPYSDCILLPIDSSSAENLSKYILDKLIEIITFPNTVSSIEIGVDEGFGQGARISKSI